MEILCTSCQRKLTIPEQYAGQLMKCPLCEATFTAPALAPASSSPAIAPAPTPEPSAVEPLPVPEIDTAPSEPSPSPSPSPAMESDYAGRSSFWLRPRYLQFVPAACLLLIGFLSFFPWVGYYPGGVGVNTQNAWQVVFGWTSTDRDLGGMSWVKTGDQANVKWLGVDRPAIEPGFGFLTLLYLLSALAAFALMVAAIGVDFGAKWIPPTATKFIRWRWALVAAVAVLSFGLLLLQDSWGFGLQRAAAASVDAEVDKWKDDTAKADLIGLKNDTPEAEKSKRLRIIRGLQVAPVVPTSWFRWVYWLHFWAIVLTFVTLLSGMNAPRPNPRVDVWW